MKLFKDILTNGGKYSQGRFYLFLSVVAYFVLLGIMTWCGTKGIGTSFAQTIIDALQWVLALFAGYVFGGKGLELFRFFVNSKKEKKEETKNDTDLST